MYSWSPYAAQIAKTADTAKSPFPSYLTYQDRAEELVRNRDPGHEHASPPEPWADGTTEAAREAAERADSNEDFQAPEQAPKAPAAAPPRAPPQQLAPVEERPPPQQQMQPPKEPPKDGQYEPETFNCCDCREVTYVMDETAVMRDATWCTFCCCGGCGCGRLAHLRLLAKCICCRQTCESTACVGREGCTGCICSLCYCHSLCQLPPRIGTPRCVCCGEIFFGLHRTGSQAKQGHAVGEAGEASKGDADETMRLYDHILLEGFTPAYCCCLGCSFQQEIMSCMRGVSKCLCCHFACESGRPTDDDGCLFLLLTCWQLYLQCRVPPRFEQNPLCACCGKNWRNHRAPKKKSPAPSNIAPAQQQMSEDD